MPFLRENRQRTSNALEWTHTLGVALGIFLFVGICTAAEFQPQNQDHRANDFFGRVDRAAVIEFRPWPSGLSRRELLAGEIRNIPLSGQYISRIMKIAAEATTSQGSKTQPIEQTIADLLALLLTVLSR
jgi:hypothetical protein